MDKGQEKWELVAQQEERAQVIVPIGIISGLVFFYLGIYFDIPMTFIFLAQIIFLLTLVAFGIR